MSLNFTRNIIFTFCLFLHSFATYGMDNPAAIQNYATNIPLIRLSQEFSKHILISLPEELSHHIFEYFIDIKQSLAKSIKQSLSLSATCKDFNNLLPEFGKAHQVYTSLRRNVTMQRLLLSMNDDRTYWSRRRAALLLIYAGADHAIPTYPLLEKAVQHNDRLMATLLFDHNANPNLLQPASDIPIFFAIQNIEMAQLFIARGVKLHESTLVYPSVLWYGKADPDGLWWCQNKIAPELIKLYLEKGISPRKIDTYYKNCILHILAKNCYPTEESQKIASMILATIPDMINKLNKNGETPLDIFFRNNNKDNFLLELFTQYGAKMSQELENNNNIIVNTRKNRNQSSTCTIA